jgi:molecular chaperone GrpE
MENINKKEIDDSLDEKEKDQDVSKVKIEDNEKKEDLSIEEKLKETEDKLLRSLAEIENQRRRFEKEVRDAFEYGGFSFAKETLVLLDNLQRAKMSIKNDEVLKDNKDLDKYIQNIEIIEKDLVSVFEKNNIKKIKCLKEKFDPNLHQAMLEVEEEKYEPGTVIQEIQPGYLFGQRLLRPSFVGVSKKKTPDIEEKDHKK